VNEALSAWDFAIGPDDGTRQVFLRNAYSDIVFTQARKDLEVTHVLSPRLGKAYAPDLRPDIQTTLDFFILGPTDRTPGRPANHPFLNRDLDDSWVAANGPFSMNEALVTKLPYGLGGKHEADNLGIGPRKLLSRHRRSLG
jgi:hypothetical protein